MCTRIDLPVQFLQWFAPTRAELDGVECKIVSERNRYSREGLQSLESKRRSLSQAEQPVSLLDDQFIGVDGRPFNIKGSAQG
jgi:hypothetical protein